MQGGILAETGFISENQIRVFHSEELLILIDQGIFRFGEHPDQRIRPQRRECRDDGQAANNTFTLTLQSNFGNCTVTGNYSQRGHMGTVDASYSCSYGISGTITLYELERTGPGMTGRFVAQNNACQVAGTLGGVER